MYKIELKTTLQMVRDSKPKMVYYGANTLWWTTNPEDLGRTKPLPAGIMPEGIPNTGGLPADPRGGVLFQMEDVEKWLSSAEAKPEHFGKHGLDAFMAAYHGNLMAGGQDVDWKPWCFEKWEDYNQVLDQDKLKT